jgi:hypothetical protein
LAQLGRSPTISFLPEPDSRVDVTDRRLSNSTKSGERKKEKGKIEDTG